MYDLSETKVTKKKFSQFQQNRIVILGIVDHKIPHEGPVEYHQKENVTFTTRSAVRNATMQQSADSDYY